jgi:hypothetical protein
MGDVVESRARGIENGSNVPEHLSGLSVGIFAGERARSWIYAGRAGDKDLTSSDNGVTIRTNRFVQFHWDA